MYVEQRDRWGTNRTGRECDYRSFGVAEGRVARSQTRGGLLSVISTRPGRKSFVIPRELLLFFQIPTFLRMASTTPPLSPPPAMRFFSWSPRPGTLFLMNSITVFTAVFACSALIPAFSDTFLMRSSTVSPP